MNDQKKKPAVEQTPQETLEEQARRLVIEFENAEKAKAEAVRAEKLAELNSTLRLAIGLYREKGDANSAEEMRKALSALSAFTNPQATVKAATPKGWAKIEGDKPVKAGRLAMTFGVFASHVTATFSDIAAVEASTRLALRLSGTSNRFAKFEAGVIYRCGVGHNEDSNSSPRPSATLGEALESVAVCFAEAFGRKPNKR